MLVGIVMGIGATVAALAAARRQGSPGAEVGGVRPSCGVSILLWQPASIEGRIIDGPWAGRRTLREAPANQLQPGPHARPQ